MIRIPMLRCANTYKVHIGKTRRFPVRSTETESAVSQSTAQQQIQTGLEEWQFTCR